MLRDNKVVAFAATADAAKAKAFYGDSLGLKLVEDSAFALVFDAGGTMLRVQKVGEFTPHPFTALGWHVDDITAAIARLAGRGVNVQRYAAVPQDDHGVWTAPDGTKVAWFVDPDGNTLSLTEFARARAKR